MNWEAPSAPNPQPHAHSTFHIMLITPNQTKKKLNQKTKNPHAFPKGQYQLVILGLIIHEPGIPTDIRFLNASAHDH